MTTISRVKVCPMDHSPNFVANDHLDDQNLPLIIRWYRYLFKRFYCFDCKSTFFKPKEVDQIPEPGVVGHIYNKRV